jgi:hypothetical protein
MCKVVEWEVEHCRGIIRMSVIVFGRSVCGGMARLVDPGW